MMIESYMYFTNMFKGESSNKDEKIKYSREQVLLLFKLILFILTF